MCSLKQPAMDMNKSPVAFLGVEQTRDSVFDSVARAMELVAWDEGREPSSLFLKVNLLSREVMPGQCTSPWVFEGVLRHVRARYPSAEICYGDCEVATSRQVDDAVRNWGFLSIGERYGARFVNLSQTGTRPVNVGPIFGRLDMPEVLLDSDALITLPIIKTHCITPFTGAMKNQWGLLPRARFKFHPVVHEAIGEVNAYFAGRMRLGVADLTVAMEGPGPRVGLPKVCDRIMASRDLVALDTLAGQYMGFERDEVEFLLHAEKRGLGSMEVEVVGDPFERNRFQRGHGGDYVVYRWRDRIAGMPVFKTFLQQDWFFKPLGWVASWYARHSWYRTTGYPRALHICRTTGYGEEFSPLLERFA